MKVRQTTFDVLVSIDGTTWTPVATGLQSGGYSNDHELFDIPDTQARFVRILGQSAHHAYLGSKKALFVA